MHIKLGAALDVAGALHAIHDALHVDADGNQDAAAHYDGENGGQVHAVAGPRALGVDGAGQLEQDLGSGGNGESVGRGSGLRRSSLLGGSGLSGTAPDVCAVRLRPNRGGRPPRQRSHNQGRHTIPASVPLNPIDSESSSKDSPARERAGQITALLSLLGSG